MKDILSGPTKSGQMVEGPNFEMFTSAESCRMFSVYQRVVDYEIKSMCQNNSFSKDVETV